MLSPTLREGLKSYAIGPKIRAIRLKKKMGLVELGRHTGLSPAMLSKVERGQLFPTLPTLLRIALVFSVGLEYFFAAARVRLSTAIDGKPSLAAPLDRSGVTFNQSHCGDLSVYAFASRTDVGIDVEAIRVIEDADHVASIAFSKREYETYERLPPSDKPIGFLNCWTRKEAFVKAVGSGLSHSLDGFDVSLMPNEPPRLLRLGSIDGSSGWQLHSFFPVSGFIAALAARATA